MAEGTRDRVSYCCRVLVVLLVTVACAPKDRQDGEAAVTPVQKNSLQRTAPLTFPTAPWLKGTIAFGLAEARDLSMSMALVVNIELHDAVEANGDLRSNSFEDQCVRVSFLYRQAEGEPERALQSARPHETTLWSPWPMLCLYAGLQTTWHVSLVSDQPPVQDPARFILLTSGQKRTASDQVSILLFRRGSEGESAQIVAKSDWVSLSE